MGFASARSAWPSVVALSAFAAAALAHPGAHPLGRDDARVALVAGAALPSAATPDEAASRPAGLSEADRQVAFFTGELLTDLALRRPSASQRQMIDHALAEHRFAKGAPDARPLAELERARDAILRAVRREATTVPVVWTNGGPKLASSPPIALTAGLRSVVVLMVENQTPRALQVVAAQQGSALGESVAYTVLPQRTQGIAVELLADSPADGSVVSIQIDDTSDAAKPTSLSAASRVVEPAVIRGTTIDATRNKPWPARVHVLGSDGQLRHGEAFAANETLSRKQLLQFWPVGKHYALPFFYCEGTFEVRVPPGITRLTMERGFEHEVVTKEVTLAAGETRDVTLSSDRFVDMAAEGWVSGDTHVHWVINAWDVDLPLDLLSMVQRAEDLRVANNLTLLQRGPSKAFINPQQAPMGAVESHSDDEFHVEMGEEYRNEDLYGHLCFLNLDWLVMPIGTGSIIAGPDALDYPINKTAILACREQGGISVEAHGLGGNKDVPVNIAHGLTDSIDQIEPDEYYRFLDCGFHLSLTNGSDHPARVLGCARAYVKVDGPFTYEKWIEGIRQCRTFTTSGPLLWLSVNGHGIGDVVDAARGDTVRVTARVAARSPVGVLEVVSNGVVVASKPIAGRVGEVELDLPIDSSSWVVARCGPVGSVFNAIQEPGVAHTSAVYVNVAGKPRVVPQAAETWIDRMRLHARDIKAKGRFANERQRDEAVAYVEEGIRLYEEIVAEARNALRPPVAKASAVSTERGAPVVPAAVLPIAGAVEAQPLLLGLKRLAEALDYIGNPLSREAQAELAALDSVEDNAEVARRVQALLDPMCIAGVRLKDGRIEVSPTERRWGLVQKGWRSYLVKVCNDAGLTTRLHVESPSARPTPHAKSADVESRWMGLGTFDGRPMQANLSGLELEYRIVQVYSRDAGPQEANLEFSIDTKPGSRGRQIREWRFGEGTDGWVAANQVKIEARNGSLHVEGTGNDPFVTAEVGNVTGDLVLRFWAEAEQEGVCQVFFWTEERPSPDPVKAVTISLHPGSAREYEALLAVEGVLAGVRIDPGTNPSKTRIDWVDLSYAHRRGETWASAPLRFDAAEATPVTVRIKDQHPESAAIALEIRDHLGRVYPEQSKRLAPDLFFQPQVYRLDGETIDLPPGEYEVRCSRGPESIPETQKLVVGDKPVTISHQVRRWIDPSSRGWWSGDHHIHAAGCLHYQNPTEGVQPIDMLRQTMGEGLNVGCCLTWGPCFDYQKRFFTGKPQDLTRYPYMLRYDVEVSGFGSHASGHLNLLRLTEQIYPGGDSKDHWPTLGLNTLRWAKAQGAVCGTAHSGNGLSNYIDRLDLEAGPNGLPHYNVPAYDGIGANEYVVDVTHELPGPDGVAIPAIDFIATMNTPRCDEWNMWYHSLNCGYRVRASGETDFPCMSGERVGIGRVYVKVDGELNYPDWVQGLADGRSYVSDALAHLLDFRASTPDGGGASVGEAGSELRLAAPAKVSFTADCAALVDRDDLDSENAQIVTVELIVNGLPIDTKELKADGSLRPVAFDVELEHSSWVALRVFPHAHTNPLFVVVDGKPIRASKASAEWMLRGVDQCWKTKRNTYAAEEQDQAKADYEHARAEYRRIIEEAPE
ncbi:MAG: CehA/McbA family metallohydrolase [Lacipirellulaceae bacterium]